VCTIFVWDDGFLRKSPVDHIVDKVNTFAEVGGLESECLVALEEVLVVQALVEVIASDDFGSGFLRANGIERSLLLGDFILF
jgi:hypothetical protein